jgi:predicted RNA binding protein YcfA (HicA-like mRNA interferase family)
MRLPRDLDGSALIRKLQKLGYKQVRQTESHVRLTCVVESREHHLTIPLHSPLRVGTLNGILTEIADFFDLSKDELLHRIL